MVAAGEDSPVTRHLRENQGIYCMTFKVKSAEAAAQYLRGKGLTLIGEVAGRFAISPDEAQGRLIYLTENTVPEYPPLGSRLGEPARFPAS